MGCGRWTGWAKGGASADGGGKGVSGDGSAMGSAGEGASAIGWATGWVRAGKENYFAARLYS